MSYAPAAPAESPPSATAASAPPFSSELADVSRGVPPIQTTGPSAIDPSSASSPASIAGRPQRTGSASSMNEAAHAPSARSASSSSTTTHLPPTRTSSQALPFTSVTACSRPVSPESRRMASSASRGGRRPMVRSATSGSLSVSPTPSPSLTPGSESGPQIGAEAAMSATQPHWAGSSGDGPSHLNTALLNATSTASTSRRTSSDLPDGDHGHIEGASADTGDAAASSRKSKATNSVDGFVGDEACFVDTDGPRIDLLALLPFELALCILCHLSSHKDLLSVSAVSRTWREIATDNAVWRDRFFQNNGWAIRSDAELVLKRLDQRHKAAATAGHRRGQDELQQQHRRPERRPSDAARVSALRSWRETLHIPSLPDLASLTLSASATLNLGGSSSLSLSTASDRTSASQATGSPSRAISGGSGRFGFFSSPARGSMTPAGRRRAQEASTDASGLTIDADTSFDSVGGKHAEHGLPTASGEAQEPDTGREEEETFVSSLDWRKLYRDRHILDQRWRRCRIAGTYDVAGAHPKSRASPRAFEPSKRYLLGHKDSVYCVRHDEGIGSGTSGKVVSGSRDRTIRVWDAETAECRHIMKGHAASVLSLQYDEQILVSGSSDSVVFVWDFSRILATTQQVEDIEEGEDLDSSAEDGDVDAAAGQDGRSTNSGSHPNKTERGSTNRPIRHGKGTVLIKLRGHTSGVLDVAFDDDWIVSCSKDTTVRVWRRSDFGFHRRYVGHSGPVNAARLQGSQVVSAAGDGSIHLWEIASGEALRTFAGHERGLACIAFSGNMVVSGSNDQTIRSWDAAKGTCLGIFRGHDHLVRAVAYDGRRRLIVSGGYDKRIKLWDVDAPEKPVREIKAHVARIFDIEMDCTRIVSASEDHSICISSFGGGGIDTDLFT